jgi:hypothetical protein
MTEGGVKVGAKVIDFDSLFFFFFFSPLKKPELDAMESIHLPFFFVI